MKLYIKNMVCDRCSMVVRSELEKLGFHPLSVELGEAELDRPVTGNEKQRLSERFRALGFELIDDKKNRLAERVKTLVIGLVHHTDEQPHVNISDYLTQHIPLEYNYLSNLFSEIEGTTIEKFHIAQKTERVKELLIYGELSLSEIADRMGYSSVAYLSAQFKKVTGLTPSHFKNIRAGKRKPLDRL